MFGIPFKSQYDPYLHFYYFKTLVHDTSLIYIQNKQTKNVFVRFIILSNFMFGIFFKKPDKNMF